MRNRRRGEHAQARGSPIGRGRRWPLVALRGGGQRRQPRTLRTRPRVHAHAAAQRVSAAATLSPRANVRFAREATHARASDPASHPRCTRARTRVSADCSVSAPPHERAPCGLRALRADLKNDRHALSHPQAERCGPAAWCLRAPCAPPLGNPSNSCLAMLAHPGRSHTRVHGTPGGQTPRGAEAGAHMLR